MNKNPNTKQIEEILKLYRSAKYKKMKEITYSLLKTFPNSEVLHNVMGAMHSQVGKYDESIKWHTKAVKINPNYAEGYNNLGAALQRFGKLNEAISYLKKATELKPKFAKAYNNIAIVLKDLGKLDQAIDNCKIAIKLDQNFFDAHKNFGNILCKLGKFNEASKSYEKALKIKPGDKIVLHLVSSLYGKTPKTAPEEYITELFDNYANRFEKHLTEVLKCKIPEKIVILIKKISKQKLFFKSTIDLGCGTGLSGVVLRPLTEYLVGVDISRQMIEKAKNKNIYDHLETENISIYLGESQMKFDLFMFADVFVYIGDLEKIFSQISLKSDSNAKFCFSVEKCKDVEFKLLKSGRYAHSKKYIDRLSKKYGFQVEAYNETELRLESNVPIIGYLFILKKI